jgi:hypothetical protein
MAFEWKYFLDVANHLHQLEKDGLDKEACCRSAVSRAYYAAFCYARNHARDNRGFIPTNTDADHREVRQHFMKSKTRGVASVLDQLRQWRNDADYADEVEDIFSHVQGLLDEAQKVFVWLK